MIRLYDGSRLVDLIFCVTTLLDSLNGCCCYIDDKYRLGTVQGSYSFRSQLGCQPEFKTLFSAGMLQFSTGFSGTLILKG